MEHACNPRTQEAEAGGSGVQSHPWVHREFEANLNDMRSFIKKRKYGLVDWGMWLNGRAACARP